jgi:sugar phosphate isomerase/epimerase
MTLPPVGLQTIVFGKKYSIEDEAVLDHVAKCGYTCLETTPKDPAKFKAMLDARGMRVGGMHTSPSGLRDLTEIVAKLRTLDSRDLSNSGMLDWNKRTLADYRETIAILNRAGHALRAEGIHLHYHNHDFEFLEMPDGAHTGMEILLQELDPSAIDLCVDVAWVLKGGLDPVKFLRTHRDRIGYLHFKDFDDEGWTELGRGKVDFAPIMQLLPDMPRVRWVMIEQDDSRNDPLESIAVSRRYLKETFGY